MGNKLPCGNWLKVVSLKGTVIIYYYHCLQIIFVGPSPFATINIRSRKILTEGISSAKSSSQQQRLQRQILQGDSDPLFSNLHDVDNDDRKKKQEPVLGLLFRSILNFVSTVSAIIRTRIPSYTMPNSSDTEHDSNDDDDSLIDDIIDDADNNNDEILRQRNGFCSFIVDIAKELYLSSGLVMNNKLNWLLLMGPFALLGDATGLLGETLCFAFSGIALIPCAER